MQMLFDEEEEERLIMMQRMGAPHDGTKPSYRVSMVKGKYKDRQSIYATPLNSFLAVGQFVYW